MRLLAHFKQSQAPRERRGWRARRAQLTAGAKTGAAARHNRLHVDLTPEASLAERFAALWTLEDELCSVAESEFGALAGQAA